MSTRELDRRSKRLKALCGACRERKARFSYRGEVRADRDHTLCFECYRGEINRARARRLTETATSLNPLSPFGLHDSGRSCVPDRQLAHRQRMLAHLQRASSIAS